jgi:radical SAM superfamily enzyme YgiQ (UPF0313 family)
MTSNRYHRSIVNQLEREKHLKSIQGSTSGLSICLAYPNSYRVGMASLGFQVVRRIFLRGECRVERTFLPESRLNTDLRAGGGLVGWESLRPVRGFDMLAFSVPFENDFLNLVRMLRLAEIPELREERTQAMPLVVAGGAAVTINPLPLARFVDVFVLGESERSLPRLISAVTRLKGDRRKLLSELAEQEGFFVPAVHAVPPTRYRPPSLTGSDVALSDIVSPDAEFGETVLIEIGRGCSMGCRFCWAGWSCRPLREHNVDEILAAIDALPAEMNRIGLIATSHYDHPHFRELVRGLRERGKRITTSSLRIDEVEAELLAFMAESGTRSVSIAPETGSDSLRKRVGKRFTNEQVLQAVRVISSAGIEKLKLYFIIGLPGESDADIEAIASLTGEALKATGEKQNLALSVNFFVPKPGTPFGEEPIPEERELRRRVRLLRKYLAVLKGLELSTMAAWEAVLQTLLSRGGEEVGEFLLRAAAQELSLRQLKDSVPDLILRRYVFSGTA